MINYNKLSDNEIIKLIQKNNDSEAIEAFYNRNFKAIVHSAKHLARSINYDLSLSPEELEADAISESFFAVKDALLHYDFKSARILSYINSKIRWHFLDLQRKNSKRKEIPYHDFSPKIDEDEFENYDYLEADIDSKISAKEQHKLEVLDAIQQVRKRLKDKPHYAQLFDALYEAFANEDNPVPAVAKKFNIKRQSVYNRIKEAIQDLPARLANEILDILKDNI